MPDTALILTVGLGTTEEFEATVRAPFRKSFGKRVGSGQEWSRICLLCSQQSLANAKLLQADDPVRIQIESLSGTEDHEDLDKCFARYDRFLRRLIQKDGFHPDNIRVDFTRGTKAMSAALSLAAMSNGIDQLRYIGATRRGPHGIAVPGCERISDISANEVVQRRLFDRAVEFLASGQFAAVEAIYPGFPKVRATGPLRKDIEVIQRLARIWGRWDAFDYHGAREHAQPSSFPAEPPAWARPFMMSAEQFDLLLNLAASEPPRRKRDQEKADAARAIAADVLSNAERCLTKGLLEDALVRFYRVLEVIGQTRLFLKGHDTGRLRPEHPDVQAWLRASSYRPSKDVKTDCYQIGREATASFLEYLKDPLAERLLRLDPWLNELNPRARNNSILIHGWRAKTPNRAQELARLLMKLSEFFANENPPHNAALLAAARFPFFPSR